MLEALADRVFHESGDVIGKNMIVPMKVNAVAVMTARLLVWVSRYARQVGRHREQAAGRQRLVRRLRIPSTRMLLSCSKEQRRKMASLSRCIRHYALIRVSRKTGRKISPPRGSTDVSKAPLIARTSRKSQPLHSLRVKLRFEPSAVGIPEPAVARICSTLRLSKGRVASAWQI